MAMVRVGLTGGIGSGKSTVAGMLAALGAAVIDADAISRSVTAAGGSAIPALQAEFGPAFITRDGALDRDRMREATYADPGVRKRLEGIVHPLVGAESARQETLAESSGTRCIVFDIPLLVESRRWRQRVDLVLVIDCPAELQVERVVRRSALDCRLPCARSSPARPPARSAWPPPTSWSPTPGHTLQTCWRRKSSSSRSRFGL
jgi:dephospho-CoA kinase